MCKSDGSADLNGGIIVAINHYWKVLNPNPGSGVMYLDGFHYVFALVLAICLKFLVFES